MQVLMRDAMKLFQVDEKTVYDWIKKRKMPVFLVNGRYRFNHAELLEWALENRVPFGSEVFRLAVGEGDPSGLLGEAVKRGGIFYEVPGRRREEALASVVKLLPLGSDEERKTVYEILLTRERLESTAIGEGVAIPHVRGPLVLNVNDPSVTLCFLREPADFGARDGKPVEILFTLISPSVKLHLLLLSRLAYCLQDKLFLEFLRKRESREKLTANLMVLESKMLSKGQGAE